MDKSRIHDKFGAEYLADDVTYRLGIDVRFANHIAERFQFKTVRETCSGGGFASIALAKRAKHVYSIEIDGSRLLDAMQNANIAGVADKITFINSDVFDARPEVFAHIIDAAFIDPDWADSAENRRFSNSTTLPPSDTIFASVGRYTDNIVLIQPPYIKESEFKRLPDHECERLYMNGRHELFCLYFGELAAAIGKTEFRI